MAADIFSQIEDLFRGQTPVGEVSVFSLHRFLASDPTFAPIAKEFSRLYDSKMAVECWRMILGKMSPRYFKYAGPKKPAAPEALVVKYADSNTRTLMEAEEEVAMLIQMGKLDDLLAFYGIDRYKDLRDSVEKLPTKRTRKKKA